MAKVEGEETVDDGGEPHRAADAVEDHDTGGGEGREEQGAGDEGRSSCCSSSFPSRVPRSGPTGVQDLTPPDAIDPLQRHSPRIDSRR